MIVRSFLLLLLSPLKRFLERIMISPDHDRVDCKEFLVRIVTHRPNEIRVWVGVHETTVFSFVCPTGNKVIETVFYREDGILPQIYRELLHVSAYNDGVIKDPLVFLNTNHHLWTALVGHDTLKTTMDRLAADRVSESLHGEA